MFNGILTFCRLFNAKAILLEKTVVVLFIPLLGGCRGLYLSQGYFSENEQNSKTGVRTHLTTIPRTPLSDLTDKMKRTFFQAAVVSILLYGCTTWTLTKRLEKKLDGNYTRMLRAILNKSWRQHPTRHQLYSHLPPITKTIQTRRTRHTGHCWRSKDELISDVLLWTPAYDQAKAGRPARTYIQQLCEDMGCSPEDLPEVMNDREKWRERVRDIRASGTTWWWWWWSLMFGLRIRCCISCSAVRAPYTQKKRVSSNNSSKLHPIVRLHLEINSECVSQIITAFRWGLKNTDCICCSGVRPSSKKGVLVWY